MRKLIMGLVMIAIIFILIFMQVYIFNTNIFFGVNPNLIYLLVAIFALWYGSYTGSIIGIICGVIIDVIFSQKFGTNTLALYIIGLTVGLFKNNLQRDKKNSSVYIVFYFTFVFEIIMMLINIFIYHASYNIITFVGRVMLEAILNSFIVLVGYKILLKLGDLMDEIV